MTALAAARNTKRMLSAHDQTLAFKVKASTKIYKGSIVVANAGYAAPATTATGLICLGRAKDTYDNSSGSAGAISAEVETGIFKFANAGGDAITQADVGADCFLDDDQTVSKTDSTASQSRAGKVVSVESDGVYVLMGLGF